MLNTAAVIELGMDRRSVHILPKAAVLARLRELGLDVEVADTSSRHHFLLNAAVRVTLRAAFPSAYRHRMQVGGRHYEYIHRVWTFNFHHHGRIDQRYCDFFVCVPLISRKPDLCTAYVIPWEARGGKMFHLPESRRAYRGRYAAYRDGWEHLRERCRAAA